MGIFDFFKSPKQIQSSQITNNQDQRKAECPYCNITLKKIPGAKTKCPNCGEFMFVRTRPKDQNRVIVTKTEADKIDEEWSIISGTHDLFVNEKEKIEQERNVLKNKFGKEPSESDIKWSILNKDLITHSQNGDWGLYRNTRFYMAEILRKEIKLQQALQTYLEVCYIDLNGPNNTGGFKNDPDLLKQLPPFDINGDTILAPAILDYIKLLIKKLELNKEQVKNIFIKHNTIIENALKLPLSANDAWNKLIDNI